MAALRRIVLADNERTLTIDHVAGIAVRHPEIVAVGGHYGVTFVTCEPIRPGKSKGVSDLSVAGRHGRFGANRRQRLRSDNAGWVPSWSTACEAFTAEVNARVHRVDPAAAGRRCSPRNGIGCPRCPNAHTRRRSGRPGKSVGALTVSFDAVTYSVQHTLADETVWVRVDCDQVVVAHCAPSGPMEVARHQRSTPGHPMIDDAHGPPRPS